jgi:hypothetical protein
MAGIADDIVQRGHVKAADTFMASYTKLLMDNPDMSATEAWQQARRERPWCRFWRWLWRE